MVRVVGSDEFIVMTESGVSQFASETCSAQTLLSFLTKIAIAASARI